MKLNRDDIVHVRTTIIVSMVKGTVLRDLFSHQTTFSVPTIEKPKKDFEFRQIFVDLLLFVNGTYYNRLYENLLKFKLGSFFFNSAIECVPGWQPRCSTVWG